MATTGNDTQNNETESTSQRYTGCVKWFNHSIGYGFVTQISDGEHQNQDIFAHQSNIETSKPVYRTLYDGETVTFELKETEGDKHPFQAVNIRGYNDISLQCENSSVRRGTRRRPRQDDDDDGGGGGGGRYSRYGGNGGGNDGYRSQSRNGSDRPRGGRRQPREEM